MKFLRNHCKKKEREKNILKNTHGEQNFKVDQVNKG